MKLIEKEKQRLFKYSTAVTTDYENGKRKFNNDVIKQLTDYYNIKVSDIVD